MNTKISYEINESQIKDNQLYILEEFNEMIKKYLDYNSFAIDFDFLEIPLNLYFIFEKIHFAGENKYNMLTCQFIISNNNDQYFYVKSINIPYHKGKTIYFNESIFNQLSSIFDYYAYLFIAYELDSYGPLLGDIYYNKATEISSMGSSSNFSSGWDSRNNVVREIKNNEFLRNARYSFYNSMDLYNNDKLLIDKIEESMNVCLENLKLVRDKFGYEKNTLKFLDSFFQEITKLLVLTENIDGIKFLYNYNSKNKEYYGEYLK